MEHEVACLETLEGGQREISATLADLTAFLKWMSRRHTEMFESFERRMMQGDDKGSMSQNSSASRHARPRAEGRGEFYRETEVRGPRQDEVRPREGRRRGARVGDGGATVERWLEDTDYYGASYQRRG